MILRSASSRAACRELSELHKVTAVNKSVAHDAVLSAEQTARQELTESLEKQRVEHHREKEQLLLEVILHNHVFEPLHYISHWWKWKNRCSEMKGDVGMAHMKNKRYIPTFLIGGGCIEQTCEPAGLPIIQHSEDKL